MKEGVMKEEFSYKKLSDEQKLQILEDSYRMIENRLRFYICCTINKLYCQMFNMYYDSSSVDAHKIIPELYQHKDVYYSNLFWGDYDINGTWIQKPEDRLANRLRVITKTIKLIRFK